MYLLKLFYDIMVKYNEQQMRAFICYMIKILFRKRMHAEFDTDIIILNARLPKVPDSVLGNTMGRKK